MVLKFCESLLLQFGGFLCLCTIFLQLEQSVAINLSSVNHQQVKYR